MQKITTLRAYYALLVLIIILSGILSRKISQIPPVTGDVLYAVMMFYIMRCLLISSEKSIVALTGLTICYSIEFSQMYQAEWINQIRNTTLGALVLGHGFLWSDMLAYALGIAFCIALPISDSKKFSALLNTRAQTPRH